MSFVEELSNKKILYIPIVSMRDHQTLKYNLECDGNVTRFISVFQQVKNSDITITIPKAITSSSEQFMIAWCKKIAAQSNGSRITLLPSAMYGENAFKTRIMAELHCDEFTRASLSQYDIIMYEPNSLGRYFMNTKHEILGQDTVPPFKDSQKLFYWCPVSDTVTHKASFLGPEIAKMDIRNVILASKTIVCTESQKQYFIDSVLACNTIYPPIWNSTTSSGKHPADNPISKIEVYKEVINPKLFDTQPINMTLIDRILEIPTKFLVYLPYRLSDPGYDVPYILECVRAIRLHSKLDIVVLYTDPNNTALDVLEAGDEEFCVKLQEESKNDYYSVLKYFNRKNTSGYKMLIPYLEQADDIVHAAISEFEYFEDNFVKYPTKYNTHFMNEFIIQDKTQLPQFIQQFFHN